MTTTTSTSRRSSSSGPIGHVAIRRDGTAVHVRCSTRDDGDFHRTEVPLAELDGRRRRLVDLPWTMLDEQHGTRVRDVDRPGRHDGASGDVLTTGIGGAVLGCWVGDCAPVVLVGERSRIAVAHAGWKGLASGVLDVAVDAVAEPVARVVLGPTIGPCCYAFGADDLGTVATGLRLSHERVSGCTADGAPSLDVPNAIAAYTARLGAHLVRLGGCTGCQFPGFSYRVRRDRQRHVLAVWQDPT